MDSLPKKPPQKGSVEFHPLPNAPEGYEGVEIGIRYVGAHKAREWMIKMQRLTLEEKARKLKSEVPSDEASLEYIEAIDGLSTEVLAECVGGAKGVVGLDEKDAAGALELLEFLGGEVEAAVFSLCQETQSLNLRQRFRAARAGE